MLKVKINLDNELVKEIKAKLKENGGYCPCRVSHDPTTFCMCEEFRNQIKAQIPGECHCGLYVLEAKD